MSGNTLIGKGNVLGNASLKATLAMSYGVTIQGADGGYYIPVIEDGVISWIATKEGMPEVESSNIKGADGVDGKDGYTPIKGVDYFDGVNGEPGKDGRDGVSVTHSWSGSVLTINSASGTSSANLKGDKGDKGDTGEPGAAGYTPVKGTDYFTAAEKAEFVESVISALPTWTGGSY